MTGGRVEGSDLELMKRFMRYVYDKAEYSYRHIWYPEYDGFDEFWDNVGRPRAVEEASPNWRLECGDRGMTEFGPSYSPAEISLKLAAWGY